MFKECSMATTASDTDPSTESATEALKRRKKQARREAKLMLAIEEAKKELKKAQKKQSKAQARLEKRSTTLHTLEARQEEIRSQSPQAATNETSQSATDAEPTSLLDEEAKLPEGMLVIQDMTGEEAMQENRTAVEHAPAPTTPKKTSAPKTTAVRTSNAPKQSSNRSQGNRKPSSDAGHKE